MLSAETLKTISISGGLAITACLLGSTSSVAQNAYIPDYSESNVVQPSAAPEFAAAGLSAGVPYSNIWVIDTKTNQLVTTIPVGLNPYGIAVSQDGTTAWVVSQFTGTLSKIDTATNKITGLFAVQHLPYGVAAAPDNKTVYVTHAGTDNIGNLMNLVTKLDTTNGDNNRNISICCQPYGIAMAPDGSKVYVGDFGSNNLSVIDTTKDAVVATIALPSNPFEVAVSPDGTRVYVASQNGNAVYVVDVASDKLVQTIPTPAPLGVAVSADNSRIYVGNTNLSQNNVVSVFDAHTYKILSTFFADYPWGFGVTPDGTKIITVDANAQSAIITDAHNNKTIANVRIGIEPLAFGVPVQPPAAPKFAGIPGTGSCFTVSYVAILNKFHYNLISAAQELGYSSVAALAISLNEFCEG